MLFLQFSIKFFCTFNDYFIEGTKGKSSSLPSLFAWSPSFLEKLIVFSVLFKKRQIAFAKD